MKIQKVLNLFERTLSSLVSSTSASFGASRQRDANKVQIKNVTYIPATHQEILQVQSETYSTSEKVYKTTIQLHGIQYIDEETYNELQEAGEVAQEIKGSDGGTYYIYYDGSENVYVKVSCNCNDFKWRFAYYNSKDGSLLGTAPPPYIGRTNRGAANPQETPGVCKHIIRLKKELENDNLIF